ncbi:MAG TPA: hypothetical protein VFW11_09660, partial [Cyclobacteriaceae bacterium]|nr:hypothetical protein [Cyclobacteriaceae bacterium]
MNCKLSIQFLRILFAVMLFQFLAPAFLTAFALEPQVSQATLHSSHDSFNFPVYLKEKDEHELSEGRQQDLALPILIDFSCIPEALTQIHEV